MDIELTASDGHRFGAWLAQPRGKPRAALVVVQEIFGVNGHIRLVADGYANDGYVAVAPALFDRAERAVALGYDDADRQRGFALKSAVGNEAPLLDIAAAIAHVAPAGKVGIVGYCWGGLLAWLSACRLEGLAAAVAYYGGGIPQHAGATPRCPVLAHFGENDAHIPAQSVRDWHARHPQVRLHMYPAGHGFNCDQRESFDAAAAQLARERTLQFFAEHLG